jgi:hypothetical protein
MPLSVYPNRIDVRPKAGVSKDHTVVCQSATRLDVPKTTCDDREESAIRENRFADAEMYAVEITVLHASSVCRRSKLTHGAHSDVERAIKKKR